MGEPDAPAFAPDELREISARLRRVADEHRAHAAGLVHDLRSCPRDLLGGSVDPERGSALLRFPDLTLVVASPDLAELRTVVDAADHTSVGLSTALAGTIGPAVLVFTIDDWTVTVAANALLRA